MGEQAGWSMSGGPVNAPTTPATMSVEAALRQIVGLYQAGRYDEMEWAARQLTAQRPGDSIAWHLLILLVTLSRSCGNKRKKQHL